MLFSSRHRPAAAGPSRAVVLGIALAALGAFAVADPSVVRGAVRSANAATCSLATTCFSESNTSVGSALSGSARTGVGVIGTSTAGAGVTATSTGATALVARSHGSSGLETYDGGSAPAADLYALDSTPRGNAVYAVSQRGIAGYFQNTSYGGVADANVAFVARGGTTGARAPVLDVANGANAAVASFDDSGDLTLAGDLYTAGNCSQGCARRLLVRSYVPREAEPMAEDVGEAMLVAGRARVALDPAFANVIDARRPYLVTLTPEGDSHGLFVESRSPSGFVVREAQGGRSAVAFAYRISAKPYGVTGARLPAAELPAPPPAPR